MNISVIGGTEGTITDIDGNYTVSVPAGAKLKFSYIGYKDQLVEVGTQTIVNVKMQEDSEVLDEVVVVGYGSQKKETLTGAVTVVSDKMLENKGAMSSPVQALQGQVPGVIITRSSGAPGDESWGMKLRGAVSANSTDPLIIIDGVEYESVNELRLLNSADIESINFLKDASAAIYGSKAAGGVILVTTKQAKEGKAKIEYSGSYTHKFVGLQPKMMSIDQWSEAIITTRHNDGLGDDDQWIKYAQLAQAYKGGYIDLSKNPNPIPAFGDVDDYVFMDTNWQDVLFGNAGSTQHNLSVSGGNEKSLYRLSVGYMYDDSTVKWGNNNNKRFNVRLTNTVKLTDRFTIESVMAYNRQDQVSPTMIDRVLTSSYPQPGLPSSTMDGKPYHWGGNYTPNWYAELGGDNKLKVSGINISENLKYQFTSYLDAVVNLGYNTSTATRDGVKNSITWYTYDGTLSTAKTNAINNPNQASTEYSKSFARTDYYSVSGYLNYHQTLGEKHNVTAMLGAQYNLKEYDYTVVTAKDVQSSLEILNGSGEITLKNSAKTAGPSKWHEAMMSYFGRFNYNYMSKYLLEMNLRYDGSSRFVGNRWGLFPSASIAWRASDEFFFDWAKPVLTDAKFRLSWGTNGNERVGNYESINQYNIGSYYNGVIGVTQTDKLANLDLSWESTEQTNIGLDVTLLDGRVSLAAEYYIKKTKDLLADEVIPSELGVSSMRVNMGNIENKGIELTINATPIQLRDFSWQTTLTYTKNKNKVLKLSEGKSFVEDGKYLIEEGSPLGQWFGQKALGIYATDEANAYIKNSDGSFGDRLIPVYQRDPNNYNNYIYGSNGKPIFSHYETKGGQKYTGDVGQMTTAGSVSKGGDIIWDDLDHDGVIGDSDRRILGNGMPTWYMGWTNYLNYKNFSLSFSFYGSFGNKIYNKQRRDLLQNSSSNMTPLARDCYRLWKYQGQITEVYSSAKATTGVNNARELSSFFLEDGDYIRLTNARLAYRVDRNFTKRFHISDLQLYVYGNNLLTWTKYKGFDPSSISNSNVLRPGIDNGRYPTAREIGFGLNVNF